jgi:hypothetical protein
MKWATRFRRRESARQSLWLVPLVFAVRVLVDIANRALSAAVNDPTTATQVLDYIEDLLLVVGRSHFAGRGSSATRAASPGS